MTETQLETRIALLEKDMSQINGLFDRLDTTIDKLSDVSNSIKQLLAVHETKLTQHESVHKDVYEEIERRRSDIAVYHTQTQVKIAELEKSIKEDLKQLKDTHQENVTQINNRTRSIEMWRWIITGGILVVSWVLSTLVMPAVMLHTTNPK